MKKAIIGAYLAFSTLAVWAACHTETIMYQGRMITCQTCCFGNNCNTTCF